LLLSVAGLSCALQVGPTRAAGWPRGEDLPLLLLLLCEQVCCLALLAAGYLQNCAFELQGEVLCELPVFVPVLLLPKKEDMREIRLLLIRRL